MLKLKNRQQIPPGGFSYKEPGVTQPITGGDYATWLQRIETTRISNGFPLPLGWREEVEDSLCRSLPANATDCEEMSAPAPPPGKRKIGMGDIKNFLAVMWNWAQKGGQLVSQEEAERRATICVSCPMNQPLPPGCFGCGGILGLVNKLLGGGHKTSKDGELKQCQACGCFNRAAVWVPLEAQQAGISDEVNQAFDARCWKKKS